MAVTEPAALVEALKGLEDSLAVMVITQVLQDRPELAPPVVSFAVPDLTYAPSKILTERRCKGTIKNFNAEMGYAYVDCKELSQIFGDDVLLQAKQIPDGCAPQTKVTFACVLTKDNKPQAFDLRKDDSMMGGMGGMGGPGMGGMMGGMGGMGGPGMGGGMMGGMGGMGGGMGGMNGCGGCGGGMPGMGGCGGMPGMGGCGGMPGMPGMMPNMGGMPNNMPNMGGMNPMMGGMPNMGGKGGGGPSIGVFTGQIKSFNPKMGYGFINSPELSAQGHGAEVRVGPEELGEFEVGAQVAFTAFLNGNGQPEAKDLQAPNKMPRMN